MYSARCLRKRQHVGSRWFRNNFLVCNRIYAAVCFRAVLRGTLACIEQRYFVDGSETEVAALALYGEAHRPALAAVRIDFEIEAAAVRVPARIGDVFDSGSG